MFDLDVVELSRLQFALTALYHFLFVPLTLGLSFILAIMETVYVMTGREIWRQMTKFWGTLFGINFAMGVATGITMEFQFGTNWAYYSHYVGDIFGVPLAIEGLTSFFLEATFVGLFFFGWNRMSKVAHMIVTWLLAIGANLSALWILIANAWMQNPVGATFNYETMRMELTSMYDVFFNPVAQSKFVHTVSAGYVTGAVFVLAVSAWYLLKGRHIELAKRSMRVAASFGLASALSVVVLGDESGYAATEHQQMKIAAIEGMWETETAPAPFTVFGLPDTERQETHYALQVPWMLGLIATRSVDKQIPGIKDLVGQAETRIRQGILAYGALEELRTMKRAGLSTAEIEQSAAYLAFGQNNRYLGYALLLRAYTDNPAQATEEMIRQAALSTVPDVPVLFWSFRMMVGLGFFFIFLFGVAFYQMALRRRYHQKWLLWLALASLPLPWVAAELGWIVAEYGRQPWAIEGMLPTSLGVSSLSEANLWFSLAGFVLFYSTLAIVDVILMVKYIKLGPDYANPESAPARRAQAATA